MQPPSFDPLDEQYRYCVHCDADCWPEVEQQLHTADCPITTGLHPVQRMDLDWCPVLACSTCSTRLTLGDHYLYRTINEHTSELVCVGCGAQAVA